ncbi:MAG: cobalt-precorrin-5B (C(1))-methyltransferase CbiD [Candidatus Methanoplasma sp.]|jgi:cobalt-precorrin-5B (C1)-methyltransferase|nr:cobalt-precorrin-5B (C(1))-methyltransferase CbiD [Candidatus Methanoplasma sp.]
MDPAELSDVRTGTGGMYVIVDRKRLRCGHTTGSCAAAASKTAAMKLLGGAESDKTDIVTPKGNVITLQAEFILGTDDHVTCAVRKDGGDDIDATHGMLIYSTVSKRTDGKIVIDGGEGIGRVTRKGLDQPVGNAAINSVPSAMIRKALEDVCENFRYSGGLTAIISAPDGERISKKTFNPRLGIVGGISILGTTGIVEPMSETSLIDTIKVELNMMKASGHENVLVVPGNQGNDFSDRAKGPDGVPAVKCSNFVGEAIDHAANIGIKGFLLIGNLGKMVKLAGGVMNTHSRYADCRMEILSANSLLAGADADTAKKIMDCISTDDALGILKEAGLMEAAMAKIMEKIAFHLGHRSGDGMQAECVVFSSKYGRLGETPGAEELMKKIRTQVR